MSRFVSQADVDKRAEERAKEWADMHERLGQPAPPLPEDSQPYDSRPLYEQLQSQKEKKEEEFQSKISLKNQWRGLDDEEAGFLADSAREEREAEAKRKAEVDEQLQRYRQATASKTASTSALPAAVPTNASTTAKPTTTVARGKGKAKTQRDFLAGVIKKKPAPKGKPSDSTSKAEAKEPEAKKRKLNGEGS